MSDRADPVPDASVGLLSALGHRFADPALLELALTHRSFANERGTADHNERLELLGDAVLGLATVAWLYRRYPAKSEGELALAKAALVSERSLALYAERLELAGRMRLGALETRATGGKATLLADGVEALFGAVFLDAGWSAAAGVVERFLDAIESRAEWDRKDAKTELQERLQAVGLPLPIYTIVDEAGPEHDKRFSCEVSVNGEPAGQGVGRTKKEAQQQAATAALRELTSARAGEDQAD